MESHLNIAKEEDILNLKLKEGLQTLLILKW